MDVETLLDWLEKRAEAMDEATQKFKTNKPATMFLFGKEEAFLEARDYVKEKTDGE